jgi:hypothetical protein
MIRLPLVVYSPFGRRQYTLNGFWNPNDLCQKYRQPGLEITRHRCAKFSVFFQVLLVEFAYLFANIWTRSCRLIGTITTFGLYEVENSLTGMIYAVKEPTTEPVVDPGTRDTGANVTVVDTIESRVWTSASSYIAASVTRLMLGLTSTTDQVHHCHPDSRSSHHSPRPRVFV